jgi:hypothetical protein
MGDQYDLAQPRGDRRGGVAHFVAEHPSVTQPRRAVNAMSESHAMLESNMPG